MTNSEPSIRSIPEAIAALNRAAQLNSSAMEFLQSFQAMLGTPPVAEARLHSSVPETLGGRIMLIAKESKVPLMPKAFADEYQRRKWPPPEGKKSLNDALSSRISELAGNGKLRREDAGYVYVPPEQRVKKLKIRLTPAK